MSLLVFFSFFELEKIYHIIFEWYFNSFAYSLFKYILLLNQKTLEYFFACTYLIIANTTRNELFQDTASLSLKISVCINFKLHHPLVLIWILKYKHVIEDFVCVHCFNIFVFFYSEAIEFYCRRNRESLISYYERNSCLSFGFLPNSSCEWQTH